MKAQFHKLFKRKAGRKSAMQVGTDMDSNSSPILCQKKGLWHNKIYTALASLALASLLLLPPVWPMAELLCYVSLSLLIKMIFIQLQHTSRVKREFNFETFIRKDSVLQKWRMCFHLMTIKNLLLAFIFGVSAYGTLFILGWPTAMSMVGVYTVGSIVLREAVLPSISKHIKHRATGCLETSLAVRIQMILAGVTILILNLMMDPVNMEYSTLKELAEHCTSILHPFKILEGFARIRHYADLQILQLIEEFEYGWLIKIYQAIPNICGIGCSVLACLGMEKFLKRFPKQSKAFATENEPA